MDARCTRSCSKFIPRGPCNAAATRRRSISPAPGTSSLGAYQGITLTEVAASAHHPLPLKRRLLSYLLKGERNDRVECRGGVRYQMNFQLEAVDPQLFWTFQQELALDGQHQGMLHRFDSSGRMALGALSYINVETRNRSLLVQAFHTFPDDYAIVKSQSLFEIP